ncbi:MAG: diaminopimelate epimerase, partial [Clostridia bacterium]|nr:diaminopimelate epimerase [Clostridia bacterium]
MRFSKVHGLGNDFVLLDGRALRRYDWPTAARLLCDRRTGVGADGLLIIEESDAADIRMRIINSDGSEAEMCGNGIRCFAKHVYESGLVPKTDMCVETLAGVMKPHILLEDGRVIGVRVDMGEPFLDCADIPVLGEGRCIDRPLSVAGHELRVTSLLIGVPHTVVFVDALKDVDIAALGSAIENAPVFPRRTNVNFAEVLDERRLEMRTWERGCGRTLCCGTGASSTAVAAALNQKTGRSVDIRVELGTLHID